MTATTLSQELTRDEIVSRLRSASLELKRLDVSSLRLFGSFRHDAQHSGSDIDLLVTFDGGATFDRYMGVKFFLEELFGRAVDLVTDAAVRLELRATIAREAIRVVGLQQAMEGAQFP